MRYNHSLTTDEAEALAGRLGVPGAAVHDALEAVGMLRDPGMEVVDEIDALASVLEDVGISGSGGEPIEDFNARTCYLAGRLLRRIAPDVAALCAAAGVDGAQHYVH